MKKTIMAAALLTGVIFASAFQSQAASEVYGLDSQFNGNVVPGSTVPWLTATFADSAPNTVTLTLQANSLVSGAFVSEWDFNFDPTLAGSLSALNFAVGPGGVGTVTPAVVSTAADGIALDGTGGNADISLAFQTGLGSGRFTAGETIVYTITGIAGLNSSDFNFASVGSTTGPWYTAAQIQGIPCPGCGGTTIAWIGDCTSTPNNAPEPATMAILGSFIAFAVYLKRRNGQSVTA
ncbi:MAG TPA: hypothetical protein VH255_09975 [Verrucomicrobiae bacterium]|nr:hypothetical protein [Verrucomicrobiae bacterium]